MTRESSEIPRVETIPTQPRDRMLTVMTTLQGEYDTLTITENTTFQGAVHNDLTVHRGTLTAQGVVHNDLIVLGGNVTFQGVVGTLTARGGRTRIQGVIQDITLEGGEVQIAAGTILGNRILQEDGTWSHPTGETSIEIGPAFTYHNAADVL